MPTSLRVSSLPIQRPRILTRRTTGSFLVCRASSGGPELPDVLSLSEAYSLLGLKENAKSEEVIIAKNRLLKRHEADTEKKMQIEQAYDLIFMKRMKARLSGELEVSAGVRFADVASPKIKRTLKKAVDVLPGGFLKVKPLSGRAAGASGAALGVLVIWALAQALLEPPVLAARDVPGLQVALGIAAAVYALKSEKNVGIGKSAGIAFAGLLVGTLIGSGVESWLRVDIMPLGGFASPGILVGEFSLIGVWAACFFLA